MRVILKGEIQGRSDFKCLYRINELSYVISKVKSWSLRFRVLISSNAAQVGPMLLLNTNRKSYMGSPMAPLHLTFYGDLERSQLRSFDSEIVYLIKSRVTPYNMKLYTVYRMAPAHFILEWHWKIKAKVPRLWRLIPRKGAELGHWHS